MSIYGHYGHNKSRFSGLHPEKVPCVIADLLSCITGYHPVMLKLSTYRERMRFSKPMKKPQRGLSEMLSSSTKFQQEHYLNFLSIPLVGISGGSTIRSVLQYVQKTHWLLQKRPFSLQQKLNTQHVKSMIVDILRFT